MKPADRNSRLLLVFSLISGLFIVCNYVFGDFNNTFNLIYSGKFGIGSAHILSSLLTAETLVIIWYALKYSYYESRTYVNYPKEKKNEIQGQADDCFLVLINSIFYVFIMTILFFILSAFLSLTVFIVTATLIVIIVILPAIIEADAFPPEVMTKIFENEFFKRFLPVYRANHIGSITLFLCILFILVFSYGLTFGKDSQFQPKLNLTYDNTTVKNQLIVGLIFNDISSEKIPVNFNIDIKNDKYMKTLKLKPKDFIKAGIIAEEKTHKRDGTISQAKYLSKGIFKMTKRINLTPYLKNGKNLISIRFSLKRSLSKRSTDYTVYNEVYYDNGSIEPVEKQFNLDLK